MLEPISILIGFCIGVVAVAIAIELAWKKTPPLETCKLTTNWSINEIKNPSIVAEQFEGRLPEGARIIGDEIQIREGEEVEARRGEARGNFAIGKDRALIFSGKMKKGKIALRTTDDLIIQRLREEFERLWRKGEREMYSFFKISELPKKENIPVITRGVVRAIVPYRGKFLMRLSDGGHFIGVLINERLDLTRKEVEVKGELKERLIEAIEIKEI